MNKKDGTMGEDEEREKRDNDDNINKEELRRKRNEK